MIISKRFKPVFSLIFLGLIVTHFLPACKTAKKIQASIEKKDTTSVHITRSSAEDSIAVIKTEMASLAKRKIDFKTFSAKVKVEYEDSRDKQPTITAYVRILKDSMIWISGYATVFNVEAFRVLVTKDSVFVLDKLKKEVSYRSMDFLQEVTQIPFDLKTLQDLFVGNPIFFSDSVISYKETESKVLLATLGQYFKHLLTLNKTDRVLLHSKLDDVDLTRNRTADITYGDYENNNGVPFATSREIIVSEKNKIDIKLNFKQYEFNKELSITFNIPSNYKSR